MHEKIKSNKTKQTKTNKRNEKSRRNNIILMAEVWASAFLLQSFPNIWGR